MDPASWGNEMHCQAGFVEKSHQTLPNEGFIIRVYKIRLALNQETILNKEQAIKKQVKIGIINKLKQHKCMQYISKKGCKFSYFKFEGS